MKNMIKTVLPAPLLSVALLLLWLALNRTLDIGHILLGSVLGLLLPVLLRGLRPLPVRVRQPMSILRLGLRVVWDTSVSNFQVVRFLLFPRLRRHPAAFVHVPLAGQSASCVQVIEVSVVQTFSGTV